MYPYFSYSLRTNVVGQKTFIAPSLEFLLTRKEMLTYFATDFTGGGNRRIMKPVNADKPGAVEGRLPRVKTDQEEAT